MTFLPNELLLTLPAGPVFDTHVRTIPNERLMTGRENDDGTAELIGRMTRSELERRARKANVDTAILLAESTTDTSFLAWMFKRDQRKSVRIAIAMNSQTPVSLLAELLDEMLSVGRKDAARSILTRVDPARILLAGRISETVHAFVVSNARRSSAFASRLIQFLNHRPVACWPQWLGTRRTRDEQLMPAIIASATLSPATAYKIAAAGSYEPDTLVNAECRTKLAGVLASGKRHTPEELLDRFPWLELANQLVASPQSRLLPFAALKRAFTPPQLDQLAVRLMSFEATLDADACEWMLAQSRYPSMVHVHPNMVYSGRHTIAEPMMVTLERTLDDFAAAALNQDTETDEPPTGLLDLPTGLLFAVNTVACHGTSVQFGRIVARLPETIVTWLTTAAKTAAGRYTPAELIDGVAAAAGRYTPADLLEGVAAANANGPRGGAILLHLWLDRRNMAEVTEPIVDLIVETLAAGQRIPSISGRDFGQVITRRDQVERLAGTITGTPVDQTKFDMAVDALWWRSPEARDAFPELLKILALAERPHPEPMSAFWDNTSKSRVMAGFSELTSAEALTLNACAPRAAGHIRATAAGSQVELNNAQRALLPGSRTPGTNIDATAAWVAIGEYLNAQLGNDSARWSVALTLLPDWQGTIEELVTASRSLA